MNLDTGANCVLTGSHRSFGNEAENLELARCNPAGAVDCQKENPDLS
jgi:hypothetical protein